MKSHGLVAVLVILCSACHEYTSHYPIGKPGESTIKSPFNGDWRFVSSTKLETGESIGTGSHFMRITPFNGTEYLIQLVPDSLYDVRDISYFRGFTSEIDHVTFANISPVDNEGKRPVFSIYKYRLKGDSLVIQGVSEERFESLHAYVDSQRKHRKFIKSSVQKPEWWDNEYKYVRISKLN